MKSSAAVQATAFGVIADALVLDVRRGWRDGQMSTRKCRRAEWVCAAGVVPDLPVVTGGYRVRPPLAAAPLL
jgi:hypothetical protein